MECYITEQTCHVVYEEMPADLERLVLSIVYPNKNELALYFDRLVLYT